MSRSWVVKLAVGAAALAAAGALSAPLPAEETSEGLYKAKCASCHDPDGSGNTPMGKKLGVHDFRSEEIQKMSDEQLTEITAKGKNKMPGYEKSLKPGQIKDLIAYIRQLAKKK